MRFEYLFIFYLYIYINIHFFFMSKLKLFDKKYIFYYQNHLRVVR